MKIETYAELFKRGRKAPVAGLCGRIIRGRKPEDFETLTDDPDRKLVMLMGPDGLESLLGKNGFDMLVEIGYEGDYIERKINEGNAFKLAVFREGGAAKPATWNNVAAATALIYPDIGNKLFRRLPELEVTVFEDIERQAGFDFSEVDKAGPADPCFMTYERFRKCRGTLAEARAFLYFTVHLRELFSGDGYTYTQDGRRGLKEYIVPNKPIRDLGECEILDIEVKPAQKKGPAMKGYPTFYNPDKVEEMYMPDLARARAEGRQLGLAPASKQKDRNLIILIDTEWDFTEKGRLPVQGMFNDIRRLIDRLIRGTLEGYYTDILITFDKHPPHTIHSDSWWRNAKGDPPDVKFPVSMKIVDRNLFLFQGSDGQEYRPRLMREWTVEYAEHLAATGQGDIWVFADHCREGTDGVNLVPALAEIVEWMSAARDIQPVYMYKGMIPQVDWFGPFRPCKDVTSHPQGGLQTTYLDLIPKCRRTEITGEAKDFCVRAGMLQVLEYFGGNRQVLETISFIDDTTSAIFPDNPELGIFMDKMEADGVKIIRHDDPFIR